MHTDTCRFCGKEIPIHPGGWRVKRIDAKFCSEKCKIDCNNARRKLARKEAALKKLKIEIEELNQLLAWDHD